MDGLELIHSLPYEKLERYGLPLQRNRSESNECDCWAFRIEGILIDSAVIKKPSFGPLSPAHLFLHVANLPLQLLSLFPLLFPFPPHSIDTECRFCFFPSFSIACLERFSLGKEFELGFWLDGA